ncbi:sensor domain-containing protein [Sulfuriferula thiophila]|uniref:sensor domain-containing protein n=1 Tax=Sulfuriferula thiophila TaxID=1781211 RepID=UPI000F604615|nr:GGDEF and EAL domain-containing protein [Sulfuriferula thiophila]
MDQTYEARFRHMLETCPLSVCIVACSDHKILFANQHYAKLTNSPRDQLAGSDPKPCYANPQDYQDILHQLSQGLTVTNKLIALKTPGQQATWVSASYSRLTYENEQAILGWYHDLTELKNAENRIHQMAFYDALTLLPNRRVLMERLQQSLLASVSSQQYGAVLFIGLDHFKTINDTKGHDIGDLLLIEAANRLQTCVCETDTVSRLSGDEFLIVLEALGSDIDDATANARLLTQMMHATLSEPYALNEQLCNISSSIGIALFRDRQDTPDNLLRYAETAMHQAKTSGRNTIHFYDAAMQIAIEARAKLEDALRLALQKQQFRLHYQIQVDNLRHPLGAEVLLRWEHPEHGLVYPAQFIPLAEDAGLIGSIGLWVLQTACAQLAAWQQDELTRNLVLAVNVSPRQLHETDFVAQVQRALIETGATPAQLKLELTESATLENIEDTIIKMREIEMLGVKFSMDDFGTGYSSLQYLKRLPLSQIKIDQTFVRDIASDPNDASIVQTIIAMSATLGLDVIAEGVENEAQFRFLELCGCRAFQGYFFSKPVPLNEFMRLLANQHAITSRNPE